MLSNKQKRIYCDHASGTPVDREVLNIMKPYFIEHFHNPGSIYKEGVEVSTIINQSRIQVAHILKARPEEIIFVDGATEANNIAIFGLVKKWRTEHPGKVPHIITTQIEHASVLETCYALEEEGAVVTYLSVNKDGYINQKELKDVLTENTVVVSIGYVNGEIGTIQDIKEIMKIIRHYRKYNKSQYPYMHTDAVQAVNYIDEIGTPQLGIDLMTLNASKIYGPKKIAILFIKTGVNINPILFGGNQEKGLRSGTENVPYIVGMAGSLILARKLQASESLRLRKLQKYTQECLRKLFPKLIINAEAADIIPNIVNISFPKLSHEEIVIRLDAKGIMSSVKSACKAGEDGDSHVIKAIRKGDNTGSIRFSFGRLTTKKDIDYLLRVLKDIVEAMNKTQKDYYLQ